MSTYVLYYNSPVVHAPSAYHGSAPIRPNSTFKPIASQPSVPIITPGNPWASAAAAVKREPVPARRTTVSNGSANPGEVNEQEQSVFFRLPAELRNDIYKELLCPDALSPRELAQQSKDLQRRGFNQTFTKTSLHPAILSTCRKVAQEAECLLYESNVFHAHPSMLSGMPHLTSPAKPVLYPSVTSQIRRWQISLRLDIDQRFTAQQAAKAFSGAEYLEVRVWQAQFEACDYSVLKLFTGVRGVKVARVGGSVDEELAHWLEHLMMEPEVVQEDTCDCGAGEEAMFQGHTELLCGRCYKKAGM